MKHFTKAVCVLDTCSIINLDNIVLAKKDILRYMRHFFDVRVCQTIREELQKNRRLVSSREISYWEGFLSKQTYFPTTLTDDQTIIGPFYSTPPATFGVRDRGEHGNTRVALELLLTRTIGHAIFVTDDKKASNAFLERIQQSFPGINLWTSADVILYIGGILLKEGKTTFKQIEGALRHVHTAGSRNTNEIIKEHYKSVTHLKLLDRVVAHWRKRV